MFCTSKKHLRKAAAVAHAAVSTNSLFLAGSDATPTASTASDGGTGTTYVGIKAQCRTYCKQVCIFEPLRHTPQYLQQQALKAFCKVTAGQLSLHFMSCHHSDCNIAARYVYIHIYMEPEYIYVDTGHVASHCQEPDSVVCRCVMQLKFRNQEPDHAVTSMMQIN